MRLLSARSNRTFDVDMAQELSNMPLPSKRIHSDLDVSQWKKTSGYHYFLDFMQQLNRSVRGYRNPPLISSQDVTPAVLKLDDLLQTLHSWIDDIPPKRPTIHQRYGNPSFRVWGERLAQNASHLLTEMLQATSLSHMIPYLTPYLVEAFGNPMRLDYGTGHEAAWMLFLCTLGHIGFLHITVESRDDVGSNQWQDSLAIPLFLYPRYLALTWRLQDTYTLEPAGSHGVWGLDDFSFVGYIFGSSQMCGQDNLPPKSVLQFIKQQAAARQKTSTTAIAYDATTSSTSPSVPVMSLYHLMLWRILQIKTGPFFEHSSQLYNIATGVQTWNKVNEGMQKMFIGEVLGKRVVVQHIPMGGILPWDPTPLQPLPPVQHPQVTHPTASSSSAVEQASPRENALQQPKVLNPSMPPPHATTATGAPWARK